MSSISASAGASGQPAVRRTVRSVEARYQDIVPDERIIYSYDMHLNDNRLSVSLTAVEFKPAGKGTRLILIEQAVFLDGYDDARSREEGTRGLLDNLAAEVRCAPAGA